jgi:integrase
MKKPKLPTGLFYRKRKRPDGTVFTYPTLYCSHYVTGRRQPIVKDTGTADIDEALRYLRKLQAEHPTARAQRIEADKITVHDALVNLRRDREARHVWVQRALFDGLDFALGHLKLADLRRVHLDEVCRRWQRDGIAYEGRDVDSKRMRPVSPATCGHGMRTLSQAREKAAEDYGLMLPPLTFPTFPDRVAGTYMPPDVFYKVLAQITPWQKAALIELAYLTGKRKGQLRKIELHNVRVQAGKVTALAWEDRKVKNRRPDVLPLTGRAQVIVQRLWDARGVGVPLFHIEGEPVGDLRSELRRACKAAGVPYGRKTDGGFVFHDTRRCALTNAQTAGVPDSVARTISGHRTDSAHRRYLITQEAAQLAALRKMQDAVEAAK